MYEALGLTTQHARIYEFLLEHQIRQRSDIAEALGLRMDVVHEALDHLGEMGLIVDNPDDPLLFSAIPPDLSLETLIRRREGELQRMRLHAALLADRYRAAARRAGSQDIVEIVRGRSEIAARVELLERQAAQRMEILSAPPYMGGIGPTEDELDVLQRGVGAQVIYAKEFLEQEGASGFLRRLRAAGEDARVLPTVPMKLLIVDRRIALVPLVSGEDAAAIVVHPSGLLDALVTLFGMLWEKACPFGGSRQEHPSLELSDEELQLVNMLASGLKDETAARHLGLGVRTTRRRIAAVMDRLGVVTRFQAGYLLGMRAEAATDRGHTGTPR